MKDIRLIATDMDGTFLTPAGSFNHQRLRRLLQEFKKQGLVFAVASGRSFLALDRLFGDFKDQIAIIAENGSLIQYKNKILFEHFMSKEQYLALIANILENPYNQGTELLLSGKKAAYILADSPQSYVEKMRYYYENICLVKDFDHLDDDIFKITTNFPPKDISKGTAWLNKKLPHMQAVTTGFESIDVILRGANKSFGLNRLCQVLGIGSEQVVAFGDDLNDFEMLTFAGRAVAPENARAEIREIADDIIAHHQEESVIAYMEGMVKNGRI